MATDTSDLLAQLGAELRHARLKSRRTQADVATAAGLARPTLTRIENGYNGEINVYLAAAHALGYRLTLVRSNGPDSDEQGSFLQFNDG